MAIGRTISIGKTTMSPQEILNMIIEIKERYRDRIFIIMGKSGPTGKSWLTYALRIHGFNAIEISEDISGLVDFKDDFNHFIDDEYKKIVIVLNKSLEIKPKKKITIILDDDVSSINVTTNVKDGIGEPMVQSKHLLSNLENGDKFDLRI